MIIPGYCSYFGNVCVCVAMRSPLMTKYGLNSCLSVIIISMDKELERKKVVFFSSCDGVRILWKSHLWNYDDCERRFVFVSTKWTQHFEFDFRCYCDDRLMRVSTDLFPFKCFPYSNFNELYFSCSYTYRSNDWVLDDAFCCSLSLEYFYLPSVYLFVIYMWLFSIGGTK